MKRYVILQKQSGGCDYTIGCGVNFQFVEADSPEEAFQKWIKDRSWDEYAPEPRGQHTPNTVQVIETVGPDNKNLWTDFLEGQAKKEQERKAERKRQADLKKLEELKRQYES